mmetsp:Transcript_25267/g.64215  ORF Transcript_25267/g.64215 Transcript_25267/m.64215 type:complete len:370 (+) Transcript_25267:1001-2110(+)
MGAGPAASPLASGAGEGAAPAASSILASSTSSSSIACTLSTLTSPCRFMRTLTLSLAFSPDAGGAKGPTAYDPIASPVSATCALMEKGCERRKVSILAEGNTEPRSNRRWLAGPSPPSFSQRNSTVKGHASCTSNSRTLKAGDSMAHCSAAPRLTHSLALRVREGAFWNTSSTILASMGTRVEEPTTSTLEMSVTGTPLCASACSSTALKRGIMGSASSSNLSRVITPRTSLSSMMHSTLSAASALALRIFLTFSSAVRSLKDAFLLAAMSILFLALNSAQKCWNSSSSRSRPPRLESHAWLRTVSPVFLSDTTDTCVEVCPTSTNATCTGSFSGRSVLKMPYASAVAVFSLIRRRQFRPAIWAALSIA